MNKGEVIEAVQKVIGSSKAEAERATNAVLEIIRNGVAKKKRVQVIGFGTFDVRKRSARKGRNPRTGEEIKIAASKTIGFKPSSAWKAQL